MKPPKRTASTSLYCFTPAVTLTTFFIEIVLGVYALVRFRKTRFGQLCSLMIFLLAIFQLAEFIICKTGSAGWSRVGWVSVTFLPVVGLHMITLVTNRGVRWLKPSYFIAAVFAALFIINAPLFNEVSCPGNYASFIFNEPALEAIYSMYYLFYLALGMGMLALELRRKTANTELVCWLLGGYASFMLPTFFIYVLFPVSLGAFPSIFCGFAVVLALIIARKVLPLFHSTN